MADEIEAQRPFIERLPEAQLTAAPIEGESSVRQFYEDLLRRERERHLPAVARFSGASDAVDRARPDEYESVGEIMSALVECRRRVVDILYTTDRNEWGRPVPGGSGSLETFLYDAALNDGEVLRRIGERLYESELRLTDPNPNPNPDKNA